MSKVVVLSASSSMRDLAVVLRIGQHQAIRPQNVLTQRHRQYRTKRWTSCTGYRGGPRDRASAGGRARALGADALRDASDRRAERTGAVSSTRRVVQVTKREPLVTSAPDTTTLNLRRSRCSTRSFFRGHRIRRKSIAAMRPSHRSASMDECPTGMNRRRRSQSGIWPELSRQSQPS